MRQNTEQEKVRFQAGALFWWFVESDPIVLFICLSSEKNKEGSFLIYSGTENLKWLINL